MDEAGEFHGGGEEFECFVAAGGEGGEATEHEACADGLDWRVKADDKGDQAEGVGDVEEAAGEDAVLLVAVGGHGVDLGAEMVFFGIGFGGIQLLVEAGLLAVEVAGVGHFREGFGGEVGGEGEEGGDGEPDGQLFGPFGGRASSGV